MNSFEHENNENKFYIVTKSKVGGYFLKLKFGKQQYNEDNHIYEGLGKDLADVINVYFILLFLFHRT
jgi:hypothetical protein